MSTEITSEKSSPLDTLKLLVSLAMLLGGFYAFYYFEEYPSWVRLLALLGVVVAAVFVAVQTRMGQGLWRFAVDSRAEVRKVVWPTRQETLQTLLIIAIAVLLTGLFLAAVDWILAEIVLLATGQG